MSANTLKQFWKASDARAKAGDRLYAYLASLPARRAIAVATRVEYLLALEWEAKQTAGDHKSWIFKILPEDMMETRTAFMNIHPNDSDKDAEQQVLAILNTFDLDEAWWTAHGAREAIVGGFQMKGAAA